MSRYACPICENAMQPLAHCKLRCFNCGYTEDCSDLFEGSAEVKRRDPPPDPPERPRRGKQK